MDSSFNAKSPITVEPLPSVSRMTWQGNSYPYRWFDAWRSVKMEMSLFELSRVMVWSVQRLHSTRHLMDGSPAAHSRPSIATYLIIMTSHLPMQGKDSVASSIFYFTCTYLHTNYQVWPVWPDRAIFGVIRCKFCMTFKENITIVTFINFLGVIGLLFVPTSGHTEYDVIRRWSYHIQWRHADWNFYQATSLSSLA